MKPATLLALVFLLAALCSCSKESTPVAQPTPTPTPAKPPKESLAKFVTLWPITYDTAVLTELDNNGKPILPSPYPKIFAYKNDIYCYNNNDGCVYCLAGNPTTKNIHLYKCNLKTKTTDTLYCINSSEVGYFPYYWNLYYNPFIEKFYLSYFYYSARGGSTRSMFELSISGKEFLATSFSVSGVFPDCTRPFFIDESNGDMYFSSNGYHCYSPITGATRDLKPNSNLDYPAYDPIADRYYCLDKYKNFYWVDLKTNAYYAISSLKSIEIDYVENSTYDTSSNQYIFWSTYPGLRIYWVTADSGKVVKQLTNSDSYESILCIPN